ncbi:Transcriptional regulatory protein [Bosea sp. LC85]|uniref:GntR family transcriptional regulator n=1 Tax=Bosea sp. LC85 TaxID=1502851 RepID=UPI0004E3AEA2|nr:GntR family transcriptional regulator [Bosea sp. LC85]KFC73082.1 Transcriptional regulatory protein [Bosea sp. LC85]
MKPARDIGKKPRKERNSLSDRRIRVSRAGLHDQAANRLRTLIVRGDLEPGEQINEAELSEALGVSRTPLREALKLLAAEGLVELRLNRSGIVTPLRRSEINDLFEAVSGIERVAAELAAARMSSRDLQKLKSLQNRMERHHGAGQLRDYFELNQQIHNFIVASSRNNTLKAAHQWLLARVERARFFALSSHNRWDESVQEHRDILDALERRDIEKAGKLLADHVLRTGQVVNELLHADRDEERGEMRAAPSE